MIIKGWAIFVAGMIQFILWSSWAIARNPDRLKALKSLFRLNPEWGPKSPKTFKEWKEYKVQRLEQRRTQSNQHSPLKKFFWILLGKYQ